MSKKAKKITIISLSALIVILIGIISVIVIINSKNNFDYLNGDAQKVILFIGDGMGENHIKNTEIFLDKDVFFTSFDKSGEMTTLSKDKSEPTDSAASASAMATGQKFHNDYVAYDSGKNITSITEIAKAKGLGVGIITTDELSGATPAGFSAHATHRDNTKDIINSQLQGNIDLLLGAGYDNYIEYQSDWENKGYSFVSTYEELVNTNHNGKIIGSFQRVYHTPEDDDLALSNLTAFAIDYFEKNYPNGYFLMIEGAHIDKMSHQNNIYQMINYLNDFDASVKCAYDKLHNEPNVSIIVTADHETGNLQLAESMENIDRELYLETYHTKKNVRYFIYQKDNEDINKIPKKIDNTSIFYICKALLNI